MQITLEYDPATGQLTNHDGIIVGNYAGLNAKQADAGESGKVDAVVRLRAAGFTAEEIVSLSASGLV